MCKTADCCRPHHAIRLHSSDAHDHDDHSECNHDEEHHTRINYLLEDFITNLEEEDKKRFQNTAPELEDILLSNKAWVKTMTEQDPGYFDKLGAPQTPKYFYIGCSDARVDPLKLMGLKSGQLFVHRNVGNLVNPTDMNVFSALEFAVNEIKVPHIIVCGHYDCGAVKKSFGPFSPESGALTGAIEYWVRNIRDVSRIHKDELAGIPDLNERQRRLVELNVIEQCLNLFKSGVVQRARKDAKLAGANYLLPRIHGLVFDPKEGILKKLDLNWKKDVDTMSKLYDLDYVHGQEFWEGNQQKEGK